MTQADWLQLLSRWTAEAVKRTGHPPPPGPMAGLGAPGATDIEIAAAEARLACRLPDSYRTFLKCTNGLKQPRGGAGAVGGHFWPVEQIEWFRKQHADWISAYTLMGTTWVPDATYLVYGPNQDSVNFRTAYLKEALAVSHDGDDAIYLLNPKVLHGDGEWEAWLFANWLPGAARYRSFAEMMLAHYDQFRAGDINGF